MNQYTSLLKDPEIIDVISVGDTDYALVTRPRGVPGCVSVPGGQLATRLREFLAHGYSQRHRQPYTQVAGVFAWALFTYSLEALDTTKKQTFSHALMGTSTRPGMLAQ